ncbi:fucolectin-like [Ranitomeya variabilis]|uniref:fucolectin-like n=1 Tax=Ranitomeya variabilis TaxID=490064 RepID=UPI0040565452
MKTLFLIALTWMVSDGAPTVAENLDHEEFTSTMEDQELEPSTPIRYRNLALHGRATQSSIVNNVKYGFQSMAINAIDGNLDSDFSHGSCSHTDGDFSPWWRVDLLKSYRINRITITNRNDCCEERLNGAEILVGDSLYNNGNNNPRCAVVTTIPRGATKVFLCHDMVGRYVNVIVRGRKEYLHMCEVQVFGDL